MKLASEMMMMMIKSVVNSINWWIELNWIEWIWIAHGRARAPTTDQSEHSWRFLWLFSTNWSIANKWKQLTDTFSYHHYEKIAIKSKKIITMFVNYWDLMKHFYFFAIVIFYDFYFFYFFLNSSNHFFNCLNESY